MRLEARGRELGTACIVPSGDVVAGRPCSWDVVYTAGPKGIATGGAIRIDVPYGFTPPQTAYSFGVGYTTVETSNPAVKVVLHLRDPKTDYRNQGVWAFHVYVPIEEGELQPGDTVTVRYGKGSRAGLANVGAFAQYFEGEAEFTVLVDPGGRRDAPHGGFQLLEEPRPRIRVVSDEAAKLFVVAPSIVPPGEPFAVRATVRDREDNTVSRFQGRIVLAAPNGEERGFEFRSEGGGRCAFDGLSLSTEGVHRFTVTDASGAVRGVSNPCICRRTASDERLYWGDIHVMTSISAGLGRPASAYQYARDLSHLDFCAATDGDHADAYYTDDEWEETKRAAEAFYAPGRFVTLLGSEYHERKVAGDKNIYYRDDQGPLLRWCDLEGEQPEALWEALRGRKAMTVPHHTVSGSGRLRPWDYHHSEYQRLVEIYSEWGNSEAEGCLRPNYWRNNFENSVQNGLAKGYRMGIIASGDSHDGLAGNSSWMRVRRGYRNGLAAVYAPELTREAIFDALWNRHCYGTTGERIVLSFTLNDAPMGQELDGSEHRRLRRMRVDAVGTAPITEVTIIRNGAAAYVQRGESERASLEWIDTERFDDIALTSYESLPFVYYYVRVVQEDGEAAWSSPVWVL